jgi:DNA-binding transcriptional regulator YdaS (Cro superfamily)
MNLEQYLHTHGLTYAQFARLLKPPYSAGHLISVNSGNRPVSARLARQIEEVTKGQVKLNYEKRKDL